MGRIILKIKKEFLKIISLNSKYRPWIFILVLIVLAIIPISVIENTPNVSICKRIFGESCPSSGITRGVSALLKGEIQAAINYNIISFLVLIIILVIIWVDLKSLMTQRIKKV
jgi:hypothetical protein